MGKVLVLHCTMFCTGKKSLNWEKWETGKFKWKTMYVIPSEKGNGSVKWETMFSIALAHSV
jgi:hypothetical protein